MTYMISKTQDRPRITFHRHT